MIRGDIQRLRVDFFHVSSKMGRLVHNLRELEHSTTNTIWFRNKISVLALERFPRFYPVGGISKSVLVLTAILKF